MKKLTKPIKVRKEQLVSEEELKQLFGGHEGGTCICYMDRGSICLGYMIVANCSEECDSACSMWNDINGYDNVYGVCS